MAKTDVARRSVSRRTLLRMMAAAGSGPVLASLGADRVFAADSAIRVADPRYQRFYTGIDGIHANDVNWVKQTKPRLPRFCCWIRWVNCRPAGDWRPSRSWGAASPAGEART